MSSKSLILYLFFILGILFCCLHLFSQKEFEKSSSPNIKELYNDLYNKEAFDSIIQLASNPLFSTQIEHAKCNDRGGVYHVIGKAFYVVNEETKAIEYFEKALRIYLASCNGNKEEDIINLYYNIGIAYQYTNTISKGKTYLDTALTRIQGLPAYPEDQKALKYQGIGNYYSELRDFMKAESFLQEAVRKSDLLDDYDAFYVHIDLLGLYLKFANYEQAQVQSTLIENKYINTALVDDPVSVAIYFLNAAEVSLHQKQYDKVEAYVKKAQDLLTDEEYGLRSNAHEILGVLYFTTKAFDKSRRENELAYQLRTENEEIIEVNLAKSFSLENFSEIELAAGNEDEALKFINEAIANAAFGYKLDSIHNPIVDGQKFLHPVHLIRQLILKGRVYHALAQKEDGRNNYIKSIHTFASADSMIGKALNDVMMDQSKLSILELNKTYTHIPIDACMKLQSITSNATWIEQAFYISSKSKARVLQSYTSKNLHLNDSLYQKYTELSSELSRLQSQSLDKGWNNASSEQFALIQSQLQLVQPDSISAEVTTVDDLPGIISHLNQKEILLEAREMPDGFIIFEVSKKLGLQHRMIKGPQFAKSVQTIKGLLKDPHQKYDEVQAVYLGEQIMGKENKDIEALIFIPDGKLYGLPLEALMNDQKQFFAEVFKIKYATNAAFKTSEKTENYKDEFIGFATNYSTDLNKNLETVYGSAVKLSNFSTSERELKSASGGYQSQLFFGKEAKASLFRSSAYEARILYFSLHGIANYTNGANSALIFDDRDSQCVFRAFELHQKPLNSELVVLSSCYTADGKYYEGEGIDGMSRAFLIAGTDNVLSSIWSATEQAALQLMPGFMKQFKESGDANDALSFAKRAYLKNSTPQLRHPYYWANFILISNLEIQEKNHLLVPYLYPGIIALMILLIVFILMKNLRTVVK
ncbi:MAG: CHAT domain-containing protein [Saprospiraceae bacterium]|nr:CHAT domain-containing protein [Saprospiraceae bacterium]